MANNHTMSAMQIGVSTIRTRASDSVMRCLLQRFFSHKRSLLASIATGVLCDAPKRRLKPANFVYSGLHVAQPFAWTTYIFHIHQ
jgi:hypothetical protein